MRGEGDAARRLVEACERERRQKRARGSRRATTRVARRLNENDQVDEDEDEDEDEEALGAVLDDAFSLATTLGGLLGDAAWRQRRATPQSSARATPRSARATPPQSPRRLAPSRASPPRRSPRATPLTQSPRRLATPLTRSSPRGDSAHAVSPGYMAPTRSSTAAPSPRARRGPEERQLFQDMLREPWSHFQALLKESVFVAVGMFFKTHLTFCLARVFPLSRAPLFSFETRLC